MRKNVLLFSLAAIAVLAVVALVLWQRGYGRSPSIVVFGEDSANLKAYESLREEFRQKTGVNIKFEGATFEQSVQKADADFRNGTGQYDIVLQYNFSLAPYVRNNYVATIDEVFSPTELKDMAQESFFQNALRETSFYYSNPTDTNSPPKQFGVPFAANTLLLVYNRDLFEDVEIRTKYRAATGKDLAPPGTWDDYLSVAEFFSGVRPEINGVVMQGAADGWLYYEAAAYLFGMGTGTSRKTYGWEENKPLSIATTENEAVLRYMKRLRASSSGDFFTVGASQQQEIMLQGKTAMAIMWSDYVQPLAESGSGGKGPRFSFATVPGNKSGLAGGAFYINRKSRQISAASQFVSYVMTPATQIRLLEKGLSSALKSAYTEEVMARVPYAQALRDSLARGVFMFEAGSDAEIINSALTSNIQKFIRGEISEATALKQAEQEVLAARK